jgi:iron complex outermembrane receptor protein
MPAERLTNGNELTASIAGSTADYYCLGECMRDPLRLISAFAVCALLPFRFGTVHGAEPQGAPSTQDSAQSAGAPPGQTAQLQEVVVTAQKRAQLIQDVPMAMSAVDTHALTESNQQNISDYYSSIPGLNYAGGGESSSQNIAIRGITTGPGSNPTVGIMIDDFPFGASVIGESAGPMVPDINPDALQRIEVLRGPQGTLYGASSMGGLIKFVTIDPSFSTVSGDISVGTESIYNASQPGSTTTAAINIPITGDLALRASGFYDRVPGYIDNSFLGTKGVNADHSYGGLLTGLWQPTDALSIKTLALYQNTIGGAYNVVTPAPGMGNYQQDMVAGTGYNYSRAELYGLTVHYTLGGAQFTLASGYGIDSAYNVNDFSYLFGTLNPLLGFNVSGEQAPFFQSTRKWTEEARVQLPITSKVDALVGGFFTHEVNHVWQSFLASDPHTGAVSGTTLFFSSPDTYIERAAFADLTFHITRRLDVQTGGRASYFTQKGESNFVEGALGPLVGLSSSAAPQITYDGAANESAYTYLVTPKFKVTRNLMAYMRLASGYRPGGISALLNRPFQPDKTTDYEIGLKASTWGGKLAFDASAYYIDWKNIQLALANAEGVAFTGNASAAKSEGVELAARARPLRGLNLSGWVDFNEAVLTQGFPQFGPGLNSGSAAYGVAGDPLPWASRFSAYLSADQAFTVSENLTGSVGADVSYQGKRLDVFTGTLQRQDLSPYAKVDAHAALEWSSWRVSVYVNNLTNRYVLTSGGLGNTPPTVFNFLQPRTVGVSISRSF